MVQRIGRDEVAHIAERIDLCPKVIGEFYRRPNEKAAIRHQDDGHSGAVVKAAGRYRRPIGDPDLGTELLQHPVLAK